VKTAIFCTCGSNNWATFEDRWVYMLRGVWQELNCFSIQWHSCNILRDNRRAGASPGETKMWDAVRENGDFFALAVRITGKLLQIDALFLPYFCFPWPWGRPCWGNHAKCCIADLP